MTAKKPIKKPVPAKPKGQAAPIKRQRVDWEAVELDYGIGILSNRMIAEKHKCSEAAVRKKSKEESWTKDLSAKVKAKTEELVRKAEVRSQVRTESDNSPTEKQQVAISAEIQSQIILGHRRDIPNARTLVTRMFIELSLQTDGIELLQDLGEMMEKPDASGKDKLNELYLKVISLPGRSATVKSLSDSLKTLVALERQAFGLDTEPAKGGDSSDIAKLSDAERAVRLAAFVAKVSAR